MIIIKKQHYLNFLKCSKAFIFSINNKKKINIDQEETKREKELIDIKNLAFKNFNNIFDASGNTSGFSIDNKINLCEQLLKNKLSHAISNCSFLYKNFFCVIDILEKNNNGSYSVFNVKIFSDIKKHEEDCYKEAAFQCYILSKNNLKIENYYVIFINKNYVRCGDIEIKKLFLFHKLDNKKIESITKNIEICFTKMKNTFQEYKNNNFICSGKCSGKCDFFDECHSRLPSNNVTEIHGINKEYAEKLIQQGIITFEDIKKNKITFKDFRKQIQIETFLNKKKIFIDKKKLNAFLKTIKFPLYYLDFETINEAIPPFDGTKPYEQIPFQYSLHIENKKGGELIHKNFLGEEINCSYKLAKQLVEDIPTNACIIAYNSSVEKNIIKKLAIKYKDLEHKLNKISNNIVDLLIPFKQGFYYDIKQGKSNSIKDVVAALCKEMKYKYQELTFVHNGFEASNMFKEMLNSPQEEKNKKREDMLKYCSLDTLNMVKILRVLYKSVEKK